MPRPLPDHPVTPTDSQRPTVLALLNAYTAGMSGGDMWFIEVARRLPEVRWIVVTSAAGARICTDRGLDAEYVLTSTEAEFGRVATTYLRRTWVATWKTRHLCPDVVWATSDAPPDVLPALCHRLMGGRSRPWVQRIFHLVPRRRGRIVAWVVQLGCHLLVAAGSDRVVVDSDLLRQELAHRGIGRQRTFVSRPGAAAFPPGHREPDGSLHGLYVGRLKREKGVLELPDIWARVVQRVPGAQLAIAGHGPPETVTAIGRRIDDVGMQENVRLLGFVPDGELPALHRRARAFLFPSHEEGFGMAVLDALSLGLPVVAWRLPALQEHFGEAVDTVDEGDLEAFARRVAALITDDDLFTSRQDLAVEVTQRFDWNTTAATERAVAIDEMVRRTRRRRPRELPTTSISAATKAPR